MLVALRRFLGIDKAPDLSWLNPPADLLDAAAWDQYWKEQIEHGITPQMYDFCCREADLVRAMNSAGMKSVLCAGNGMSHEPRILAMAGFDVVALDISPLAIELARKCLLPPQALAFYCGAEMQAPGGRVEFALGNILDPAVCPGPFDVIIERRTAQVYLRHNIGAVMEALARRLGPDGILLSHSHDGSWKPPAPRRHYVESWFQDNQWIEWTWSDGPKPAGRVAWLVTSTG